MEWKTLGGASISNHDGESNPWGVTNDYDEGFD